MPTINIYCDESCHLENDQKKVMVLGAAWGEIDKCKEASRALIDLKKRHGLKATYDMKWVTVSPSKLDFFLEVIDYFFDSSQLMFRAIIVPDKGILDHKNHNQTHDDWYYKMFFVLLKNILNRKNQYRIYLDIKDTRSNAKVVKLGQIIQTSMLDFDSSIVERLQQIRSHESQLIQFADLFIGAVGYANRGLTTSRAKLAIVQRVREKTGLTLTKTTLPSERKFNLFSWNPQPKVDWQ
jgi:hypothetical protein